MKLERWQRGDRREVRVGRAIRREEERLELREVDNAELSMEKLKKTRE